MARPRRGRPTAGTGTRADHRPAARRRATAGVPGVAGRAPGGAGAAGPRLRASRRSASARQHPPTLMAGSERLTLALDVGGTKIAAGLADPSGALVYTAIRPTQADRGTEVVWSVVAELIDDALRAAGGAVGAVGIASAGPVDLVAGTVSPVNIVGWRGFKLCDRVAAALPDVPVRLGGDGLCMALGEHRHGAGRDARFLLGMVVSTGVGGGLVLDGAPYDGRTGNAGHVGHVIVDTDGPPCACGARGCAEAIASGPNLVKWAHAQGWAGADAKELADAAASGNAVALKAFRRGARAIA